MPNSAQDSARTDDAPQEAEILECMVELMKPIPELTQRFSAKTIMFAMVTHGGQGARDLLARGKFTADDVMRLVDQFRDVALGATDAPLKIQ